MRHLGWLSAIAVAILAIQMAINSATLSVGSVSTDAMNIDKIQMQADKNMPVMVIDNPI